MFIYCRSRKTISITFLLKIFLFLNSTLIQASEYPCNDISPNRRICITNDATNSMTCTNLDDLSSLNEDNKYYQKQIYSYISSQDKVTGICLVNTSCTEFGITRRFHEGINRFVIRGSNFSVITGNVFSRMTKLKILEFSYSHLKSIPVHVLWSFDGIGLVNLHELNLQNNEIERVEEGALKNLSNLRSLRFSRNQIHSIDSDALPDSLRYLYLDFNHLNHIPNIFHRLKKLETIDLSNNFLTKLTAQEFNLLPNLKHLFVNDNRLVYIDKAFKGHQNVRTINISNNNFTSVNFVDLPSLYELDISKNNIVTLSADTFFNCSELHKINISHNHLEKIDVSAFNGSHNIYELDFSYNRLRELPKAALSGLQQMGVLRLSYNHISDLESLENVRLNGLTEMNLLTKFDSPSSKFLNLTYINLEGNPIVCYLPTIEVLNHLVSTGIHLPNLPCKEYLNSYNTGSDHKADRHKVDKDVRPTEESTTERTDRIKKLPLSIIKAFSLLGRIG